MSSRHVLLVGIAVAFMLGLVSSAWACSGWCGPRPMQVGKVEGGVLKWSYQPVWYDCMGHMHKWDSKSGPPCVARSGHRCGMWSAHRCGGNIVEAYRIARCWPCGAMPAAPFVGAGSEDLLKAAQALYDAGDYDAAIRMAMQARQWGRNWKAYSLLGRSYQRKGDWGKAADAFKKALSYGSKDPADAQGLKEVLERIR